MRWGVHRLDILTSWMERAETDERAAMMVWFRAMLHGPAEVAHGHLHRPGRPGLLCYAQPPELAWVVAYLIREEHEDVVILGVEDCVDGLIVNAAHRASGAGESTGAV